MKNPLSLSVLCLFLLAASPAFATSEIVLNAGSSALIRPNDGDVRVSCSPTSGGSVGGGVLGPVCTVKYQSYENLVLKGTEVKSRHQRFSDAAIELENLVANGECRPPVCGKGAGSWTGYSQLTMSGVALASVDRPDAEVVTLLENLKQRGVCR